MTLADAAITESGWINIIVQAGGFGALCGLLFWFGPRALKYLEEKDKAHVAELATVRQEHREERKETVQALNKIGDSLDRLAEKVHQGN